VCVACLSVLADVDPGAGFGEEKARRRRKTYREEVRISRRRRRRINLMCGNARMEKARRQDMKRKKFW